MTGNWTILAAALILDAAIGDPDWLWRRAGHPVAWIGRLIDRLDRNWNLEHDSAKRRRLMGCAAVLVLVALSVAAGLLLESLFKTMQWGWLGIALVAAILLAGRSLFDHVVAVARALGDGLPAARRAVARIVGRDPETLDEAGVARAAIESAAESLSDGLVAPALWFAVFGLPGILVYKAVNTADSMIGHRDDRHRDFGWAAARLDDLLNWPAARLSALLIALSAPVAGGSVGLAFSAVAADARHHASPNAGWPEAAMAGALDIALGGSRSYGGETVDHGTIHAAGKKDANENDVRRALRVVVAAGGLLLAIVLAFAFVSTPS